MTIELRFQPYRLFPYERELALRELAMFGLTVLRDDGSAVMASGPAQPEKLARLTYFREILWNGTRLEPALAAIERRYLARTGAVRPRQATRYLVHGLHEYKGKFHPQVVRAFANLLAVGAGDLIIDPFCGSGTTLVESLLLGCDTVGVDRSPMGGLVTEAKLAALTHPHPSKLGTALEGWVRATAVAMEYSQTTGLERPVADLEEDATDYLRAWFTKDAFSAITVALEALHDLRHDRPLYLLASVVFSSILRASSLQAPEDLRVRRRRGEFIAPPLGGLLLRAGSGAVAALKELEELDALGRRAEVVVGDVAEDGLLRSLRTLGQRAAVITSPPYATALPYVDTDRLSLIALGLVEVASLRPLEAGLIGSREWRVQEDRLWNERLASNSDGLPDSITQLCETIRARSGSDAGFRRRAVPGLLYRYFAQMAAAFGQVRLALEAGERAVFIVGVNRTGRRDNEILIDTPRLLGEVASGRAFELDEILPLETWPRYGLHHENGVRGESAILLTAI